MRRHRAVPRWILLRFPRDDGEERGAWRENAFITRARSSRRENIAARRAARKSFVSFVPFVVQTVSSSFKW
jgi:hypothetical protein